MAEANHRKGAIFAWRYQLVSAFSLNAAKQAPSVVEGFLVRYDDGFGCVQPWAQFGQGSVGEAWQTLAAGGSSPLIDQALACCRIDGAARRRGESLWHGLKVPHSHATLTHFSQTERAYSAGFRLWKVKCGPLDLPTLGKVMAEFPDVKFRIDCNETADPQIFEPWVKDHAQAIDLIEDPYPHQRQEDWFRLANWVPLAMDRIWSENLPWIPVWKPAWNALSQSIPSKQTIVTSAMDHPIGQAWAAYQAALVDTEMICGLRTDHLFQTNVFSDVFSEWSSYWPEIAGFGLGWNEELELLPWIRLN